jgi:hypothetical protein
MEGGQIRMEEFQALMPAAAALAAATARSRRRRRRRLRAARLAALVTIARNIHSQTATLEMPFWLFMGPLALGAALLALAALWQLRGTWRRGRPDDKHTTLT